MKKFVKLMTCVTSIAAFVGAVIFLLALAGVIGNGMENLNSVLKWVLVILSLIVAASAAGVAADAFSNKEPKTVGVKLDNGGSILYTEEAVKEMVLRTANGVENVREAYASIDMKKDNSVGITVRCTLRTEKALTETVAVMQREISDYFGNVAGLPVEHIHVIVNKTTTD